jgi:hypothetical protein
MNDAVKEKTALKLQEGRLEIRWLHNSTLDYIIIKINKNYILIIVYHHAHFSLRRGKTPPTFSWRFIWLAAIGSWQQQLL